MGPNFTARRKRAKGRGIRPFAKVSIGFALCRCCPGLGSLKRRLNFRLEQVHDDESLYGEHANSDDGRKEAKVNKAAEQPQQSKGSGDRCEDDGDDARPLLQLQQTHGQDNVDGGKDQEKDPCDYADPGENAGRTGAPLAALLIDLLAMNPAPNIMLSPTRI